MKKQLRLISLAAALLTGGFLFTPAQAADPAPAPAAPVRMWQRIAEKLDLTRDQRTQIKAVFTGEKTTLAPLVSALRAARKDLRTAIWADDASETAVRAASAKVATAEADLAVERMQLFSKISTFLTESQRQQLASLQAQADTLGDRAGARRGAGLDQ